MHQLIKFLTLTLLASSCFAQSPTQKAIEDYYNTYHNQEQFTAIQASILIPKDKTIDTNDIQTYAIGTVGFPPYNEKVSKSNLFEIGSITKSFTALIMLQLQMEGKLNLEDNLGKWLPQYKQWSKVTLRELLTMTSGIPNYSEDKKFDKLLYKTPRRQWTNEELISYAYPNKPIKKATKNRFEYCNTNYILAAMVIEQVTQDSYAHQLQQRILNSKYLNNTFYPLGANARAIEEEIAPRMVYGYYFSKKTNKNVPTYGNNLSWAGAAGALISNSEDVVKWVQLLFHGLLIDARYRERAIAELEAIVSMKTGQRIPTVTEQEPYGFGLGVGNYYDAKTKQRFWVYEGSTTGFRVMYFWQSCNDVTTVIALNSKAGEGDKKSPMGDHILEANSSLYQAIMQEHPQLRCKEQPLELQSPV